jgi:hypothetical protein
VPAWSSGPAQGPMETAYMALNLRRDGDIYTNGLWSASRGAVLPAEIMRYTDELILNAQLRDLVARFGDTRTAFMEVARAGDTGAMAVILDVRYNRSITTTQIGVCWLWCISEDLAPAVEFFFQRRLVPDIDALSLRNEQISVLANGIPMNSLGSDSPFLYAVRQNSYDAARVLLAHGANVNYRNEQGATAIMYAVGRWRDGQTLEFVRYLRQRGADARLPNNNGLTALQFANNILLGAQAHNEAANIIGMITAVRNALP